MPVYLLAEAGFGATPAEPRSGHDRLECADSGHSRDRYGAVRFFGTSGPAYEIETTTPVPPYPTFDMATRYERYASVFRQTSAGPLRCDYPSTGPFHHIPLASASYSAGDAHPSAP